MHTNKQTLKYGGKVSLTWACSIFSVFSSPRLQTPPSARSYSSHKSLSSPDTALMLHERSVWIGWSRLPQHSEEHWRPVPALQPSCLRQLGWRGWITHVGLAVATYPAKLICAIHTERATRHCYQSAAMMHWPRPAHSVWQRAKNVKW